MITNHHRNIRRIIDLSNQARSTAELDVCISALHCLADTRRRRVAAPHRIYWLQFDGGHRWIVAESQPVSPF